MHRKFGDGPMDFFATGLKAAPKWHQKSITDFGEIVLRPESPAVTARKNLVTHCNQAQRMAPLSALRQVSRESANFLGAGRAALLQLAHPWVAAALLHHSNLITDAICRFHSTFR